MPASLCVCECVAAVFSAFCCLQYKHHLRCSFCLSLADFVYLCEQHATLLQHTTFSSLILLLCAKAKVQPHRMTAALPAQSKRERESVLSVRYVLAFRFRAHATCGACKESSGHTLALSLAAVEETTDYSALSLWGQRSVAIVMPTLTARRGRCRGTRRVVLLCCVLCLKETENVFFVRSRKSLS